MNIDVIDRSLVDVDDMVRVVRAAPPERFQMRRFYAETACGTAACVAGWCRLDGRIRSRHPVRPTDWCEDDADVAYMMSKRMVPALRNEEAWAKASPDDPPLSWTFLYGQDQRHRVSMVDDAPFDPTPEEIAALGADYARGLAEREAALNRLRIVRACLERWREAIVAQQESAPVAREAVRCG